jgi:hypothetical protein
MSVILKQSDRFNLEDPQLCPALKWKALFVAAPVDPTLPSTLDHHYWCVYTQTCLGPDGALAEPRPCSAPTRKCHREAKRDAS